MNDLQEAIECLKKSQHYEELADFADDGLLFNLFEVMGVRYRELTHSSVLAWLLSDEANIDFTKKFLDWVADEGEFNDEMKGKIANFQTSDDTEVICEYGDEKSRIDVFAHFKSLELVVGIEVKVWAGEQERQVERYQCFLKEKHPNDKKVVIFLTPWGYEPSTANNKCSDVPVVCMSWGDIVDIINGVNGTSEKIREKYDFRKQFSQHIERNILVKAKVFDLLSEGDNAASVHKILMNIEEVHKLLSERKDKATIDKIKINMPSLKEDYLEGWKQIVADVCDVKNGEGELEIETLSSHRREELKIQIKEWDKAQLPFTLMLKREDAKFSVKLLLWYEYMESGNKYFDECNERLKDFEKNSNGIVEYDKWKGDSYWCSVLLGGEKNETHNLYKKCWKDEAKSILESQLLVENKEGKTLLQLINDKLEQA